MGSAAKGGEVLWSDFKSIIDNCLFTFEEFKSIPAFAETFWDTNIWYPEEELPTSPKFTWTNLSLVASRYVKERAEVSKYVDWINAEPSKVLITSLVPSSPYQIYL